MATRAWSNSQNHRQDPTRVLRLTRRRQRIVPGGEYPRVVGTPRQTPMLVTQTRRDSARGSLRPSTLLPSHPLPASLGRAPRIYHAMRTLVRSAMRWRDGPRSHLKASHMLHTRAPVRAVGAARPEDYRCVSVAGRIGVYCFSREPRLRTYSQLRLLCRERRIIGGISWCRRWGHVTQGVDMLQGNQSVTIRKGPLALTFTGRGMPTNSSLSSCGSHHLSLRSFFVGGYRRSRPTPCMRMKSAM